MLPEILTAKPPPGSFRRSTWILSTGGVELVADAAVAQAQERGYRNLTLWVLRENQRARSFYEAVGFSRDGEGKTDTRIIGTPLHEVRYVKSL